MFKKNNKAKALKKLRKSMWCVKWFFHFTRNNPCNTKCFSHRLKAIEGYDNWPNVRPEIRQAWEAAAGRFDAQYGLVKAWWKEGTQSSESPDRVFFQQPFLDAVNTLTKAVDAVSQQINALKEKPAEQHEQIETLKNDAASLHKAAADLTALITGSKIPPTSDAKPDPTSTEQGR